MKITAKILIKTRTRILVIVKSKTEKIERRRIMAIILQTVITICYDLPCRHCAMILSDNNNNNSSSSSSSSNNNNNNINNKTTISIRCYNRCL